MNLLPILTLLFSSEAQAEDSPWTFEPRLRFVVGAESRKEEALAQIYKSTNMFPMAGIGLRIHKNVSIDLDSSLFRLEGNLGLTEFQMQPLYTGAAFLVTQGKIETYFGAGANFVNWVETPPDSSMQGTKLGTEARLGVRIATNYAPTSVYPPEQYGPNPRETVAIKGIDFDVGLAQRFHHIKDQEGFNLGAFRVMFGLQIRL